MSEIFLKSLTVCFLLGGVAFGQTQNAPPREKTVAAAMQQSEQFQALVRKLRLARSQASAIGRKHPQYETVQQQLAELEEQLQRLRDTDHRPGPTPERDSVRQRDSRSMRDEPGERLPRPDASASSPTRGVPSANPLQGTTPSTVAPGVSMREITTPPLEPWHLKPVGGWSLPAKGAGGKGLVASQGGLYVEHGSGVERLMYVYGHPQANECHLVKVSLTELGSDVSNRLDWPTAVPVRLLKGSHTIADNSPYDLCRPHADGPLLTTGRVLHATKDGELGGPWMSWFDEADGATAPLAVERSVDRRPTFAGGFCTVPRWFADDFLGGRDFGVVFGGYQPAEGSSPSLSLFAADRPANRAAKLDRCLELLSFRSDRDAANGRSIDDEQPLWKPPPEVEIDWQQTDIVSAGPVWIDTPELSGLCYWSVQGLGDRDDRSQATTLDRQRRVRLYVYHPNQLAKVARGELRPYQVKASFFEWSSPFGDDSKASCWPIGAFWDAADQLLYISYQNRIAGREEVPPTVLVYRVEGM